MNYDVVIAGGGPAGLSTALALGRARKRVLLCDAGPRRNAAAEHMHNFITRDGTPPQAFRDLAREQLRAYPHVAFDDSLIRGVSGARGEFRVGLATGDVRARRIVLCTGMIDELLPIPGFAELWGRSIVQCPYCHGYEARDQRWGFLSPPNVEMLSQFALTLRGWTDQVVVFTNSALELPAEVRTRLEKAGIQLQTAPVTRLVAQDGKLKQVELDGAATVACELLFAHPAQRQVSLVSDLGVAVDELGYVRTDPVTKETSVPGVYAAGDLATRMQGAILAAAAGTHAAAMLNHELTAELALSGALTR